MSCTNGEPKNESNNAPSENSNTTVEGDETSETLPIAQGDPVPIFTVDWPSEMLPTDFPNLGKVTKVFDSRFFGKMITINWTMLSEDQVKEIVDKLNAYLDYDHAWQGSFYSDGIILISD
ncbi:MAG: hypothetical protein PHR18_02905 [Oscillospiraceae bacterium]|nr:hypothetical protein [Oscillospiraceae bacterium]MDD3832835.1 hypothetical protein [Oscillospiraceae bacterium]